MENWRNTYCYRPLELVEFIESMKKNIFYNGWMCHREIYLQAEEQGLVKLPEGTVKGDCHRLPVTNLIFTDKYNEFIKKILTSTE